MLRLAILVFIALLAIANAGPFVKLHDGEIEGTTTGEVGLWRGIPYAKPPVGDRRWRPPQKPLPWSGTLTTKEFRHNCMQAPGEGMGWPQPLSTLSEDCLYLNVYAPASKPSTLKPVMLWIYGGGFQGGGGNETRLNGSWDVALTNGDLIVVTFNYRLNVFGFLASDRLRSRDTAGGTGNYGILDQRMAMEWVQQNIKSFGGDPSRVFIVGQSAGANSVSNHLVRSKSWGLFSSAGMESGAFYNPVEYSVRDMEPSFSSLLAHFGCEDVSCLLNVSAVALVRHLQGKPKVWQPVVDGVDLIDAGTNLASRGHLAHVPVLVGSVMEDIGLWELNCNPAQCTETDFRNWARGQFFNTSQIDRLTKLYSDEVPRPGGTYSKWYWAAKHAGADSWGTCPARRVAQWSTSIGQNAYWYYWTYPPKAYNGRYPNLAHHACEQPFVFHVLSESPAESAEDHGAYHIQAEEKSFSAAIVQYWASFATSKVPSGKVRWPDYDGHNQAALVIGDPTGAKGTMTFEVVERLRSAKCDFWDDHFKHTFEHLRNLSIHEESQINKPLHSTGSFYV